MRGEVGPGVERGQLHPGDEGETLHAMASERDGHASVVRELYSKSRLRRASNDGAGDD